MIYLTYNDQPSGIYNSQVIDVCRFLKTELKSDIRLIAFISLRGYSENKRKIRTQLPDAIVLPMFPRHSNWKKNTFLLRLRLSFLKGKQTVICRGMFTTNMALSLKEKGIVNKVVFDARGAYKAEFSEYLNKVVKLKDDISELERAAVHESDLRLAVSNKLVDYWVREYAYKGKNHVVIPCTLEVNKKVVFTEQELSDKRKGLGFEADDVVLVYSGSTADWQSAGSIDELMMTQLKEDPKVKVLLLSRFDLSTFQSWKVYPSRIVQKWLDPNEVPVHLAIADYGLLIREISVTNEVASPTKFAEYLSTGLKIIISAGIGDFPSFVAEHNAGSIYGKNDILKLEKSGPEEKNRMRKLASSFFTKEKYIDEYKELIS